MSAPSWSVRESISRHHQPTSMIPVIWIDANCFCICWFMDTYLAIDADPLMHFCSTDNVTGLVTSHILQHPVSFRAERKLEAFPFWIMERSDYNLPVLEFFRTGDTWSQRWKAGGSEGMSASGGSTTVVIHSWLMKNSRYFCYFRIKMYNLCFITNIQ